MGKQINYYMEYESFLRIAEKAAESGCEIIRHEHSDKIIRGFSADIVTAECKSYLFHIPQAGEITFGEDMYGKLYVNTSYSSGANSLIEASYSYISKEEKRISRARLFCQTGFYDKNGEFVSRPECVTKIYNALARFTKKVAPNTELTENIIDAANNPYVYTHKVYISQYCRDLIDDGYFLR